MPVDSCELSSTAWLSGILFDIPDGLTVGSDLTLNSVLEAYLVGTEANLGCSLATKSVPLESMVEADTMTSCVKVWSR